MKLKSEKQKQRKKQTDKEEEDSLEELLFVFFVSLSLL